MKSSSLHRFNLALFCMLVLAVVMTGCATFESVNWNERVGTYTVDDAKAELGPPDATEDLENGGVKAQWITQQNIGAELDNRDTGNPLNPTVDDPMGQRSHSRRIDSGFQRESALNLTFDKDGVLQSWHTSLQ